MNATKILIRYWAYPLLLLLAFAQPVRAVCNASATTTPSLIDFGTVPSQNVPAGGLSSNGSSAAATFSITCTIGLSLQLLSTTTWVSYTAQQALTLSNGTDTISYTIASNSTYTPAITASGQTVGGPTGFSLIALGVLTSGHVDIPLYIKTLSTTLWPNAGTYTGTQTLAVAGVICTGIGLPGVCIGTNTVSSNVTLSLKLVVSKSCVFVSTTTLVDFGTVSFLDSVGNVQLNVTLTCTHLEDYVFYADNGNNYGSSTRRLKSPAGNYIAYSILQPSPSTTPLDSVNSLSRFGTGASETLNLPVKITSGQSTPPAAVYTDSVRMVIEY